MGQEYIFTRSPLASRLRLHAYYSSGGRKLLLYELLSGTCILASVTFLLGANWQTDCDCICVTLRMGGNFHGKNSCANTGQISARRRLLTGPHLVHSRCNDPFYFKSKGSWSTTDKYSQARHVARVHWMLIF